MKSNSPKKTDHKTAQEVTQKKTDTTKKSEPTSKTASVPISTPKVPKASAPIPIPKTNAIPVSKTNLINWDNFKFRYHDHKSEDAKLHAEGKTPSSYGSFENRTSGHITRYFFKRLLGEGVFFQSREFSIKKEDKTPLPKSMNVSHNVIEDVNLQSRIAALKKHNRFITRTSTDVVTNTIVKERHIVVSDYLPGFAMSKFFNESKIDYNGTMINLTPAIFLTSITNVLYCLMELHVLNIMHGDLHLGNILIDISQPEKIDKKKEEETIFIKISFIDFEFSLEFGDDFYIYNHPTGKDCYTPFFTKLGDYLKRTASPNEDLYRFSVSLEKFFTKYLTHLFNPQQQQIIL